MKTKNVCKCDRYVRRALVKSEIKMGASYSVHEQDVWWRESKRRFENASFSDLFGVGYTVLFILASIIAIGLSLFFPLPFIRMLLSQQIGIALCFLYFAYIVVVEILCGLFVVGMYAMIVGIGKQFYRKENRKLTQALVNWANRNFAVNMGNGNWWKTITSYEFFLVKFYNEFELRASQNFYKDAREKLCSILSEIQGLVTQEQVNDILAEDIAAAKESRDTDALIIACYLSEFSDFEVLKETLFSGEDLNGTV